MSARDSVSKLDSLVVVTEPRFGTTDPDGVADSTAALQSAVSSSYGQEVGIPDGTFAATALSITDSIAIRGPGELVMSGAGGVALSVTGDNATIAGMTLTADPAPGATVVMIKWNGDDLLVRDLVVDGQTTQDLGVRNHVVQLVYPDSTNARSGLTLDGLDVTQVSYSFLKANTDVGAQSRIKVWGGHYHNNYAVDLAFNSPHASSTMSDVLVIGASFGANKGAEVTGNSSHRMTAAGNVTGFRFIGNHASGQGQEIARVEETATLGVIALNTADLSSGSQNGIEITDNDVGGTDATPHALVLLGNALKGSTASARYGISLVSDASAAPPVYDSVVLGNVLDTWESGLRTAKASERNLLALNVVKSATNGIKAVEPTLGVTDNMLIDCTNQFSLDRGGLFGRVHFRQTDQEVPTLASMLAGSALCAAVTGWTYETQRFDLTDASSTDFDLLPAGLMISGVVTLFLHTNAPVPGYTVQRSEIEYDGTNLRHTNLGRKSSGAVVLSATDPLFNNAGTLAMRVVNGSGSAVSGVRVQIVFDGFHLWD